MASSVNGVNLVIIPNDKKEDTNTDSKTNGAASTASTTASTPVVKKEPSSSTSSYGNPAPPPHIETLGLIPSINANSISQRAAFAIPMEYPSMSTRSIVQKPHSTLFGGSFQGGFISILYAIGKTPLEIWDKQLRSGHVKRITDTDIRSLAVEVANLYNPLATFITTPIPIDQTLGIRLPIVVLVVKNLKRYFTFDIQVLDSTSTRRRFRASYSSPLPSATHENAVLPLRLEDGWNQVSMNLAELTRKIYGTHYVETTRVQIYANSRLRRVYFCDKLFGDEELPADFKVFVLNSTK